MIELTKSKLNTPEIPDELVLRILMCFLTSNEEDLGVMGISRTLGVEKWSVSRILQDMEKGGLVDRSGKKPVLTEKGLEIARDLSYRNQISLNHLLCKGIGSANAAHDANVWSLYCTQETMDVIKGSEEKNRMKYELRDREIFSGAEVCKRLSDGTYTFPYLIYREHIKNGNILSMANNGFEHPCSLSIMDGRGQISLTSVEMSAKSKKTNSLIKGHVSNVRYFKDGRFISCESNGKVYTFPMDAVNFVNVGDSPGNILHGTISLQMDCSVGVIHMPTATATFAMMI